jgi:hypothetical protein
MNYKVSAVHLHCINANSFMVLLLLLLLAGCTDMLVADLTELPAGTVSWKKVCSVPPGSPLSSEGISLL